MAFCALRLLCSSKAVTASWRQRTLILLWSPAVPLRSVCAASRARRPTDAAPPHSTTSLRPHHSANAVPSTALHLLTATRPPDSQTNRSTAPASRSIRFSSLRFHSAPSVSAVQRKRTQIGASLSLAQQRANDSSNPASAAQRGSVGYAVAWSS